MVSSDYKFCQQAIQDGNYGKFMGGLQKIKDINEVDDNLNSLGILFQ